MDLYDVEAVAYTSQVVAGTNYMVKYRAIDDDDNVYDDYGDLLSASYRSHCYDLHTAYFFKVQGRKGSLKLQNVYLIEIRAQYSTLIYIYDSCNLILENTHLMKVQTSSKF